MPQPEPIAVDVAAAAEEPADEEVRSWAAAQRVFISSVMVDLREERRAAADAVRACGAKPVWFEEFGGRDDDPEGAYTSEVASSDIYVGLLGARYGRLLPDRFSATHKEYLAAEVQGLRISVWAAEGADLEGRQRSFLDEVRTFHVTGNFSSPGDLASRITARLRQIAAEDLSPWCKLGPVVFRASSVTESRDELQIVARVKHDAVAARLEGMRPGGFGAGFEGLLIYAGRAVPVRVSDVVSTTTAARARQVEVQAARAGRVQRATLTEVSLQSGGRMYAPSELAELGLRAALLGERLPADIASFTQGLTNPFDGIRDLRLSEELIRPVTHLLLTEMLVGSGRAERITRYRLGPPVAGRRRIVLQWLAASRYGAADLRTVEGAVEEAGGRAGVRA